MEKQFKKKITWVIKNFSSLRILHKDIYSDEFLVGGCKWRLCASRQFGSYLGIYLEVAKDESLLPFGWRSHARYFLSIVNQNSVKDSKYNAQAWFDERSSLRNGRIMLCMNDILPKDSGFLVHGELKIVAEVEVFEVIGKLKETSTIMELETMDVNGFQILSSQVEFVCHMFERHPEIASEFRSKNPNLRTGYMSLLLGLIETLRQSPHELHKADLAVAYAALRSMTDAGFKLDWLVKRLDEMSEKKEKEEAGEIRMQEIEEELKDLKQKCSNLKAQLAKEKAEVSAAKTPFSFDDVM